MTRFEMELSGKLGEFWKAEALKEVERVRGEFAQGQITIDGNGVARNCIGRVVVSEVLTALVMITDRVSAEATEAARDAENAEFIRAYRANRHPHTAEQLAEMRNAFGAGTVVVDVLTGERVRV